MTNTVRRILTRICNQECDNQKRWEEDDKKRGIDFGERKQYIQEMHDWMKENDIPIEPWEHS